MSNGFSIRWFGMLSRNAPALGVKAPPVKKTICAACSEAAMGMLVMDRIEGAAYPPQLSVRTAAQRKGFGRRLPAYAIEWAAKEELWLTTCRDVPWTRPFYERHGFVADRLRRRSGKKPDARGAARSIR